MSELITVYKFKSTTFPVRESKLVRYYETSKVEHKELHNVSGGHIPKNKPKDTNKKKPVKPVKPLRRRRIRLQLP